MSNLRFGLNTRNISTSYRTAPAVNIGSLKGTGLGSTSRIYKWCHQNSSNPIACVFSQISNNSSNTNPSSNSSWQLKDLTYLNLGTLLGNVGENGQIIFGGSNGGQLKFSNDFGETWNIYPNSPNLPSLSISWSSVVMSDDTLNVIGLPYVPTNNSGLDFTTYNGIHYTNDGGSNWNLIQSCPLQGGGTLNFNQPSNSDSLLFIDAGISQDGQYMAALTTPRYGSGTDIYLIFSNNSGSSWTAISIDPNGASPIVTTIATSISIANNSGTNDYFIITSDLNFKSTPAPGYYQNGTICVSSDGGTTFSVPGGVSGNDFVYSSLSDDGVHQVFVTAANLNTTPINSRLYLSRDSGSTFVQLIELSDTNYIFAGVSMSADGNIITASVSNNIDENQYLLLSIDNGNNWRSVEKDTSGNIFSNVGFLNLSKTGKYQILTGTNKMYINNNYGK